MSNLPVKLPTYSQAEEAANRWTHGLGMVLSVVGLGALLVRAVPSGDGWALFSAALFGATMVLLYTTSTLYHSAQSDARKGLFRRLDHMAIYLLIAGSYTPFCLISLRHGPGLTLFVLVWTLALAGIGFKLSKMRFAYPRLSTFFYVAMGWMAVLFIKPFLAAVPTAGLLWVAAGGLCYTVGAVFYLWDRLPFNHAIWHLWVLGGSMCHFFAVLWHVLPYQLPSLP